LKDRLKEITDITINELLGDDIILPSKYFQSFDKNAKNIDIDIEDDKFDKKIDKVILDEFNNINTYMHDTIKTINKVEEITQQSQKAIEQKNSNLLKSLYNQISTLKDEISQITNNIYKDYLTKFYNKKWLYFKYLNSDASFKKDAIIVLIDVEKYSYISKTYNKLIANNLLIYISEYIDENLENEQLNFKIVRFLTNKLVIIFEENNLTQTKSILNNIANCLFDSILQSNSGVLIKPTFTYSISEVKKDQPFNESMQILINNINKELNKTL